MFESNVGAPSVTIITKVLQQGTTAEGLAHAGEWFWPKKYGSRPQAPLM